MHAHAHAHTHTRTHTHTHTHAHTHIHTYIHWEINIPFSSGDWATQVKGTLAVDFPLPLVDSCEARPWLSAVEGLTVLLAPLDSCAPRPDTTPLVLSRPATLKHKQYTCKYTTLEMQMMGLHISVP